MWYYWLCLDIYDDFQYIHIIAVFAPIGPGLCAYHMVIYIFFCIA